MKLISSHINLEGLIFKNNGGLIILVLTLLAVSFQGTSAQMHLGDEIYNEPHRPQFHFSPKQNWTNDPNGLVYWRGWYHLFYQYNPEGNTWGNMSWGHAKSRDLMHWQHQPVAIPETPQYMIFSGSAVIDHQNTSGFGTSENPPMVAIYTAHYKSDGLQTQHLAYSTDEGSTWTRYSGNPVLDLQSHSFRDPKVFWHDETGRWIMAITLSGRRQVQFYGSSNLKQWQLLSTFGPEAATGGLWEVPDLFQLPVHNQPGREKWVLQVDINRGGPHSGSASQYFVGSFDGRNFLWDQGGYDARIHRATLFEDFESEDYGDWTANGDAFGPNPAKGTLSNQRTVSNYLGVRLVNTFYKGDGSTGVLRSPVFEIRQDYINFLIGGGNHPGETGMQLIVKGDTVRNSTGRDTEALHWDFWNVEKYLGDSARIEIYDHHKGSWGHINVDHIVFDDEAAFREKGKIKWVDYGRDFYAFMSWNNIPETDGRTIGLAWMNDWQYARDIPTSPWRGSMTLPRTWQLIEEEYGEYSLIQTPVAELSKLRKDSTQIVNRTIQGPSNYLSDKGVKERLLDIELSLEINSATVAGIILRRSNEDSTMVGYNAASEELFIDRTGSGMVDFHQQFPGIHAAPLSIPDNRLKMRILVDRSSIEVFAEDGKRVLTERIFPGKNTTGLRLYTKEGSARLDTITVWPLESVWDSTYTGIKDSHRLPERPGKIKLKPNYPNPFNPSTTIAFMLPERQEVDLEIYNVQGRKIKTLIDEPLPAGRHQVRWNGKNGMGRSVASGFYLYRLKTQNDQQSKLMVLIK